MPADARIVLQLDHVSMQFGGVVAVDDLTMVVHEGEIVALIGPNGAGKTTAFNVVTGVYAPTNGRVTLFDEVIAENHPRGRMKKLYRGGGSEDYRNTVVSTPDRITKRGVARTFQNIRLFRRLSVFENVLIAQHAHIQAGLLGAVFRLNRAEERAMRERTEELLQVFGLYDVKDEIADGLPYGRQRRLEIARALSTGPELLLLDEPAAGMNPQETEELTAFIHELRETFSVTIFMIEHHMNLVMDISDRIYVIDFGRLIASGTPEEVQQNEAVIAAYLGVEE